MGKQVVSKERRRKAKKRDKRARSTENRSLMRGPAIAFAVLVLLWAGSFFGVRAHQLIHHGQDPAFVMGLASQTILGIAAMVSLGLLLRNMRREYCTRNSRIVLLVISALLGLAACEAVLYGAQYAGLYSEAVAIFLMPYAMAPILVTLLLGSRAAFVVGIWVTLVLMLQVDPDQKASVLFTGLLASTMAGHMTRFCRRRTRVVRTGLIIGTATLVCVLAYGLDFFGTSPDITPTLIGKAAAASILSGLLASLLALLLVPSFEHLFAITTDISLLEFSDLGHPLLQRMALEAPGTYHHSLVVANIAQAAADAIRANSLEARVCAYFHDIGKLTKPNFFTENIHLQRNPHDDLPPSMSSLVITSHVKEGISLALLHKLPQPVMRVIREHHGNSTLSYFHHKAKTQLELRMQDAAGRHDTSIVDETTFRYGGPRPSTKVSAIICLADAVEAASRSLEKVTPGHIENLVADIVRMRIEDGQLDACDLKMCELTEVRRAFVFTLTNMLHARVPYPKNETKHKNEHKAASHGQPQDKDPNPVPDTEGTKPESGAGSGDHT
jgi:putative nucleotidyltransferase with HDIG domain